MVAPSVLISTKGFLMLCIDTHPTTQRREKLCQTTLCVAVYILGKRDLCSALTLIVLTVYL